MTRIIRHAAALFGIGERAISGPGRTARLVEARHAVCYAAWKQGYATTEIGRALNRDHSTVCYGRDHAEQLATRRPYYAWMLKQLTERN